MRFASERSGRRSTTRIKLPCVLPRSNGGVWTMDLSIIAIWHYLQMLGYGLSGLTVIGFMKIGYDAWRGGRFIALVLSDVPVGRTRAYRKMLTAFWHAKTLMIDFKAPRLAAARYIAEL